MCYYGDLIGIPGLAAHTSMQGRETSVPWRSSCFWAQSCGRLRTPGCPPPWRQIGVRRVLTLVRGRNSSGILSKGAEPSKEPGWLKELKQHSNSEAY